MERKSFVFYKDWKDAISDLPDDIRLEIYESIIEYAVSGAFQGLKPMAKIAFNFIKTDLDRDIEKYQKVINRNKENIGKRWSKENTKNTSGISGKTENTKNTDNDNDNDNVSKETKSSDDDLGKKAKNPPSPPPDDSVKDQSQNTKPQAPPPTPSPARSTPQPPSNFGLLPVREAAEAAMNEPIWVENIRMKHKLSMGGLRQNIEEFIPHCCSRGKEKDSLMGFKQHFDSWMDKKRQFGENGQNGAQKGRYEKLTQTRNEALKMLGIDDD